jgi:hypothetical protein
VDGADGQDGAGNDQEQRRLEGLTALATGRAKTVESDVAPVASYRLGLAGGAESPLVAKIASCRHAHCAGTIIAVLLVPSAVPTPSPGVAIARSHRGEHLARRQETTARSSSRV